MMAQTPALHSLSVCLMNDQGTHKAPKDKRPESANFLLVLSCKSLMKLIGNAASEKSTHAATAFHSQSVSPHCVPSGLHTSIEIPELCLNIMILAMPWQFWVPLLRDRLALAQ